MPEIKIAKLERGEFAQFKARIRPRSKKEGGKKSRRKKGETSIYHAADL